MKLRQLVEFVTVTILVCLCPQIACAQTLSPVNTVPLGVTLRNDVNYPGLNATDVTIPLATGTNTGLFRPANLIKIDGEYLLITAVTPSLQDNPALQNFTGYSTLTASRAQYGSGAATHAAGSAVLRVYQLDVLLASPNAPIGAYQLNVQYDSSKLSIVPDNVFPGTGPLGTPVAVNTKTPGTIILNSFNASTFFSGAATPVARLLFTGAAAGTANISVNLNTVSDTLGNDLVTFGNGAATTLSASSVTVSSFIARRVRGQVTSQ